MAGGRGAKRKRSGGQRQRIRQMQEEYACQSRLASWLLSMYAWGEFSIQRCQRIAHLVVQDFEAAKENDAILHDLHMFSQLGANGTYPNKTHAQIMQKTEHLPKLPEPYVAELDFTPPLGKQKQSFFLPHEVFSSMYHFYPGAWKATMIPSEEHVQKWWESVQGHPLLQGHPLPVDHPNYKSHTVPLLLHGDGVPVTGIAKGWSKVATIFSWASMLTAAATRATQKFIWGAFDKLTVFHDAEDNTWNQAFAVMTWSFQCLYAGKWPHTDHSGNPLHGNFEQKSLHVNLFHTVFNAHNPLDLFHHHSHVI